MRRLQTLLSITRAITSNRNVLLLELASALVPWQQCSQHMQQDESKVILRCLLARHRISRSGDIPILCLVFLYAMMTLSKQAF